MCAPDNLVVHHRQQPSAHNPRAHIESSVWLGSANNRTTSLCITAARRASATRASNTLCDRWRARGPRGQQVRSDLADVCGGIPGRAEP